MYGMVLRMWMCLFHNGKILNKESQIYDNTPISFEFRDCCRSLNTMNVKKCLQMKCIYLFYIISSFYIPICFSIQHMPSFFFFFLNIVQYSILNYHNAWVQPYRAPSVEQESMWKKAGSHFEGGYLNVQQCLYRIQCSVEWNNSKILNSWSHLQSQPLAYQTIPCKWWNGGCLSAYQPICIQATVKSMHYSHYL